MRLRTVLGMLGAWMLLSWALLHGQSKVRAQWEYQSIEVGDARDSTPRLNQMGDQGWELILVRELSFSKVFYFKRQK